jgi:hypothetical protein
VGYRSALNLLLIQQPIQPETYSPSKYEKTAKSAKEKVQTELLGRPRLDREGPPWKITGFGREITGITWHDPVCVWIRNVVQAVLTSTTSEWALGTISVFGRHRHG